VAHKFREIHAYTGILDFERGREDRLVPYPWLTDTALGPWCNRNADKKFTAQDLRFTQSKDGSSFYAITLGWQEREFTVHSLQATANAGPGRVELLGFGPVSHRLNAENQIVVSLPTKRPGDHAFAFKFTGFKTALYPSACFEQPDAIRLEPAQATCAGRVHAQESEGRPNIGF
jgi:hypothetical protein